MNKFFIIVTRQIPNVAGQTKCRLFEIAVFVSDLIQKEKLDKPVCQEDVVSCPAFAMR